MSHIHTVPLDSARLCDVSLLNTYIQADYVYYCENKQTKLNNAVTPEAWLKRIPFGFNSFVSKL